MCKILEIPRSTYYKILSSKKAVVKVDKIFNYYGITTAELDYKVRSIYDASYGNYGSRKISNALKEQNLFVSRYKVLKITKRLDLTSGYTITKKKPYNSYKQPKDSFENVVSQDFISDEPNKIVTSDLTYIKHQGRFLYICFIVDVFNREIVGYNVSQRHDTKLVIDSLHESNINLEKLEIFHSDRGGEFRGKQLNELLGLNNITQSMSKAGCPFDNAVSESLFNIFKREWKKDRYLSIEDLKQDVDEFVNWYNYFRSHSHNSFKSPAQKRNEFYERKSLQNT